MLEFNNILGKRRFEYYSVIKEALEFDLTDLFYSFYIKTLRFFTKLEKKITKHTRKHIGKGKDEIARRKKPINTDHPDR